MKLLPEDLLIMIYDLFLSLNSAPRILMVQPLQNYSDV